MVETKQQRINRNKVIVAAGDNKKEENFAGQNNKRRAKAKPTASEQRNIQKLFRRNRSSIANQEEDVAEIKANYQSKGPSAR